MVYNNKEKNIPTYTYSCLEPLGGCGVTFETFQLLADHQPKLPPICQQCQSRTAVRRNFKVDFSTASSHIKTQTLGSLAEKNTNSMSKDARLAQWRKDNAYKFDDPPNEPKMKLPRGAKHIRTPVDLQPPKPHKKRKVNK